jgi:hypothetical protein
MLAAALIGAVGVKGAFTFNACTFFPLLISLLIAVPSIAAPSRHAKTSIGVDIREGLKFVWSGPGTRRLTIMRAIEMSVLPSACAQFEHLIALIENPYSGECRTQMIHD